MLTNTVCPACEGEGGEESYCVHCSGSGEGMHDGTRCSACRGSGMEYEKCELCDGEAQVSYETAADYWETKYVKLVEDINKALVC